MPPKTFQVQPPENFDFSKPLDWPQWIKRYERFSVASGLSTEGEHMQVCTLIYTMGGKADEILPSFKLSEADANKIAVVKARFQDHFIVRRNVIFERARFNNRRQEAGEPADGFITALHSLAEHCNYGTLKEEMIRDRIVVGLRDEKLAEKLQMDSKLTLVKAVDMTHQSESVKSQQTVIRNPSSRDPYRGDQETLSSTSIVIRESTQSQQQRPGHSETHPQSRYSSRIVRPRYYRNLSDNQSDDSAVARENDPDDTASHDDDHSDGVRTRDETRPAGPPDTSARRYPKRSRLHMDAVTCMNDAAAGEGASALAAPHTRRTSSRDPHRGLYPRASVRHGGSDDAPRRGADDRRAATQDGLPRVPPAPASFCSASQLLSADVTAATRRCASESPTKSPPDGAVEDDATTTSCSQPLPGVLPWTRAHACGGYRGRGRRRMPKQSNNLLRYFSVCTTTTTATRPAVTTATGRCSVDEALQIARPPAAGGATCGSSVAAPADSRDPRLEMDVPATAPVSAVPETSVVLEGFSSEELDKYGLLGGAGDLFDDEWTEEVGTNYFERLPLEVIENILCQLPLLDLSLHVTRVCCHWNNIVSNELFVPWKKSYHKLKLGDEATTVKINEIMSRHSMANEKTCLINLIKYMKDFKPVTARNMGGRLHAMASHEQTRVFLLDEVPQCMLGDDVSPWSLIAAFVVMSRSVRDVRTLLSCLLSPRSDCTALEVLECLYCVATFLLAFKDQLGINGGLHYRVFYALYLHENTMTVTRSDMASTLRRSNKGQQCISRYGMGTSCVRLTHEQLRIVNHQLAPGAVMKVVAFAGTGKTTTLLRYTQLRPHLSFLLVVYNKSVQQNASKMFPKNVDCRTGHSLAYGPAGRRFAFKMASSVKVSQIASILPSGVGYGNLFLRAKQVATTLECFIASADMELCVDHVPRERSMVRHTLKVPFSNQEKANILREASAVWERMSDPTDKDVCIPHDGYLKVFQLQRPLLEQYDCIMMDESQDSTPAMADVVLRQTCAKIFVGDPHQKIYGFRGAINSLNTITDAATFYLTQSFRFGPEISYVASCLLEKMKGETRKTLVGGAQADTVTGEEDGKVTILARTNFSLFSEAIRLTDPTSKSAKRISFVGGLDGFGMSKILDIYALFLSPAQREKEKLKVNDAFIKRFSSLVALETFANDTRDMEMLSKIKMVRAYSVNIPFYIQRIKNAHSRDPIHADVILSTAHKAKGLEFVTVRLMDDFLAEAKNGIVSQHDANNGGHDYEFNMDFNEDEINLLYVAVTRAKRHLVMSPLLTTLLSQKCQEKFVYPVCTGIPREATRANATGSAVQGRSADLLAEALGRSPVKVAAVEAVAASTRDCCECKQQFTPRSVTFIRHTLRLFHGNTIEGGYMCKGCAGRRLHPSVLTLGGATVVQAERRENEPPLNIDMLYLPY